MITSFSNPNYGLDTLNSNLLLTPSYEQDIDSLLHDSNSSTSLDNDTTSLTSFNQSTQNDNDPKTEKEENSPEEIVHRTESTVADSSDEDDSDCYADLSQAESPELENDSQVHRVRSGMCAKTKEPDENCGGGEQPSGRTSIRERKVATSRAVSSTKQIDEKEDVEKSTGYDLMLNVAI